MIKPYKFDGKTYYCIQLSFTDMKGKRHQPKVRFTKNDERISSKRQARELEVILAKELKAQKDCEYSQLSFKEYWKKFLEQKKLEYKPSTLMQYQGRLGKWLNCDFENKKLGSFDKSYLHSFIYNTISKLGGTNFTQKRVLKYLRKIFESAVEEGYLLKNPCKGIKVHYQEKPKLVLNTQQVNTLLTKARATNHPFYHVWSFALFTGMRSGELYALRWADIDLERELISVHASWNNKNGYSSTKSSKSRIVPISAELKELLIELSSLGPFKGTLSGLNGNENKFDDFVLQRLGPWKVGNQAKVLKDFCLRIGLPPVKFHDLRSSMITNLLSSGASAPHVMSIVGHERMATTDAYLRLAGVDVKGVTNKLTYSLPVENQENLLHFGKNE